MKKISIIVPVYNVERYIERCVESICQQTYTNTEIILVDDGSTDSSGKICDELAVKDPRIRVIHQQNSGLSAARNAGLAVAKGEYIAFVDSDDYIAQEMYSVMIENMEKYDLDIIGCTSFRDKGGKISGKDGDGAIRIMEHDEMIELALDDYDVAAWDKVYKKCIWNGLRFLPGRLFEDSAVSYLYFDKAKKVGFIDRAFYYYVKNQNSITQTSFQPKGRYDYYKAYLERLDFAESKKLPCRAICVSRLLKAALSCLTAVYICEKTQENEMIYQELKKTILAYRDEQDAGCRLNAKYKLYLYTFGRIDSIHKVGVYLSLKSKQWKKRKSSK